MRRRVSAVVLVLFCLLCIVSGMCTGRAEDVSAHLRIVAPAEVYKCSSFEVVIWNDTSVLEDVSVTFGNSTQKTDANGSTWFTSPFVVTDTSYTITASLEGYANASTVITILNMSILTIIVRGNQVHDVFFSPIQVTIVDQCGDAVNGVSVTLSGEGMEQTITTLNGTVLFSVDKFGTGTYKITAVLNQDETNKAEPVIIEIYRHDYLGDFLGNLTLLSFIVIPILVILVLLWIFRKQILKK